LGRRAQSERVQSAQRCGAAVAKERPPPLPYCCAAAPVLPKFYLGRCWVYICWTCADIKMLAAVLLLAQHIAAATAAAALMIRCTPAAATSAAFPPSSTWAMDADYGTPLGICNGMKASSKIFVMERTTATVAIDCTTFTPVIKIKTDDGSLKTAATRAAPPPPPPPCGLGQYLFNFSNTHPWPLHNPNGSNPHVQYIGTFATFIECEQACRASPSKNCTSWVRVSNIICDCFSFIPLFFGECVCVLHCVRACVRVLGATANRLGTITMVVGGRVTATSDRTENGCRYL
jgi:hypothetical protein